jgi:hypothetical protein
MQGDGRGRDAGGWGVADSLDGLEGILTLLSPLKLFMRQEKDNNGGYILHELLPAGLHCQACGSSSKPECSVPTVETYQETQPRGRAVWAVETLKALNRFEPNMKARELTDDEIVAGILLGVIE